MKAELDPVCRALGITLDELGPGLARLRMSVTDAMVNGHGTAHGGYLFLLADAAFFYACNTRGPVTVAHSAQVTFLRPAFAGDQLVAEAAERVQYGRSGIYDVTVQRCGPRSGGESRSGGEIRSESEARSDSEIIAEFRGQSVSISGPPIKE